MDLRFTQKPEMDTPVSETSAVEVTLKSVDEQNKQATEPVLRRVEEICALLARRTELESTGNSEASVSRRNDESNSSSGNWHDKQSINQ